jgi:hypothetical protein
MAVTSFKAHAATSRLRAESERFPSGHCAEVGRHICGPEHERFEQRRCRTDRLDHRKPRRRFHDADEARFGRCRREKAVEDLQMARRFSFKAR